jgi:SAM-dependent methyltransferase/4-amino-4-deoxy-L-arabinose transferase-like glycosyltransferase
VSAQAKDGTTPPAFAAIASDLRDHIIEHYERRGEELNTPSGLLTLDTNSVLAASRARLLLRLLAEEGGGSVAGRRVLDLGAGFGSLALYCAHLGAEVIAVDPNQQRMQVALAIARQRGLSLRVAVAHAQSLPFPDASFDLVLANNSLCYIVDEGDHLAALSEIHRVLRPGGWVVIRNPNRLHPRDQFTGLPLLPLLPLSLAQRLTDSLGRHRSQVRLRTPGGSIRQLRRAGFSQAHWRAQPGRRLGARFAGYQHTIARRRAPARIDGGVGERDTPPIVPYVPLRDLSTSGNGSGNGHPQPRRPGLARLSTGGVLPVSTDSDSVAPAAAAKRGGGVLEPSVPGSPSALSALDSLPAVAWLRRHWEAALYVSMALAFIWMRVIDMQISFWDDEAATVVRYIDKGPAGIYSSANYTPNDHILYSLLSWVTINILGRHEPTYRIWSVVPAILSAVLLVVWSRRRLGRTTALALAAVLLTAPYLLYETVQARGYGLAQLGMVLVLIAAFEIEERGPRRWPLRALAAGIVIGPASHAMSAVGIAAVIAFLLRRVDLRRPVLKASLVGALLLAIILAPLAPAMVSQARKWFVAGPHDTRSTTIKTARPPLPIASPVTGPVNLGMYTGELLETGKVNTACGSECRPAAKVELWDAPLLLLALVGAFALWRHRRRGLLGCLLAALVGGFALPMIGRVYVADRFVLYLLPAYALLAAVGIAAIATEAARRRVASKATLAAIALIVLIYGGLRMYHVNEHWNQHPPLDYKGMADAFVGSGIDHAVTNSPPNVSDGLTYYLGDRVSYAPPGALERDLCSAGAPFAFVQLHFAITPAEESCLLARHASSLDFHGGGDQVLRLWLVQATGEKRFATRLIAKAHPSEAQPTD